MNKSELIEAIAKSADISKAAAEKALDGTLNGIKAALKKGSSVTLVGFGTFKVGKRALIKWFFNKHHINCFVELIYY